MPLSTACMFWPWLCNERWLSLSIGMQLFGRFDAFAVLFWTEMGGPSVNDLTHRDFHASLQRVHGTTLPGSDGAETIVLTETTYSTMDNSLPGTIEGGGPRCTCHVSGLAQSPFTSPSLRLEGQMRPCAALTLRQPQ